MVYLPDKFHHTVFPEFSVYCFIPVYKSISKYTENKYTITFYCVAPYYDYYLITFACYKLLYFLKSLKSNLTNSILTTTTIMFFEKQNTIVKIMNLL